MRVVQKRFLITGASGMLGSALSQAIEMLGHAVIRTDILADNQTLFLDVRDSEKVLRTVDQVRPDWILHLAAETDADRCETEPDHAHFVNVIGTENVAYTSKAFDIPMAYISSGAVFDGKKSTPYTEFDRPNPVSVYAKTKWKGEKIVQQLLNRHLIIRTGWLMGGGWRDKKFVAKILKRMQTEKEIPVVTDKFGSPTFTKDLAWCLTRLILTKQHGLFHIANRGSCSRFEVARAILDHLGRKDIVLRPVSSDAFPLPAPRTRSEALENHKLHLLGLDDMRPWKEALKDYLDTLKREKFYEGGVHDAVS